MDRARRDFFDGNATFQGNVNGNSMGGIGDYMRNQTQQGNNQIAAMPQNYGNLPQLNNQLQEQGGMNQFPGGIPYGGPARPSPGGYQPPAPMPSPGGYQPPGPVPGFGGPQFGMPTPIYGGPGGQPGGSGKPSKEREIKRLMDELEGTMRHDENGKPVNQKVVERIERQMKNIREMDDKEFNDLYTPHNMIGGPARQPGGGGINYGMSGSQPGGGGINYGMSGSQPGGGGISSANQGQPKRFTVPGGEVVNGSFRPSQAQSSQPSMGQGAQEALEYANRMTSGQDNSNDGGGGGGGGEGGGGQNSGLPYQGIFGLDEIMKGFYGSKPDSDVGKAIKGTFASNFIQSAADHLQAKDMAYTQQGIALTNMKAAANLEKANNAYMMADEYRYGLGTMDAQYNYTNNFANAQYERDLGMLSAKGVDTRKTQDNLSRNRINEMVTGGQQQRLNTQLQGQFDVTRSNIAANASMYGADRSAQASMYGSQKSAEAQMYSAKEAANASRYGSDRSAEASMYGSAAARDASMYGSDRSAQASMYGAAQQRDAQMHTADRSAQASMYGAAASRDASMYGSDKNLEGSKYVSDNSLEGSKYGSDKSLEGSKYASDASVTNTDRSARAQEYAADASKTASMYGSDKQLEGVKDTNITSTRNIRTTGDETRKTADQANKFQIEKENRANARSRAGARRY